MAAVLFWRNGLGEEKWNTTDEVTEYHMLF